MEPSQTPLQRVADLVARFQGLFGVGEGDKGVSEGLRYVIYARKSTDTAEKQERSIGDQIYECKALAERLGLRWVEVVHEEKSAMVSDKREKFRAMLDGIRAGKYDGIISWAPDRLARNMKEGGEIIDMLDHGDIQDLRFANNFIFNNDPSGKMLLDIAVFLIGRGFPVTTNNTKHRKLVINEKFVSDLLRDPFYAGVMIFGEQVVNLFDQYDFVPAVSAEDFERVCKLDGVKKTYKLNDIIKPRGDIKADLMRGMVVCGRCNRAMSTGITKGLFYYRCDTQGCPSRGKSTRAKVILEAAFDFLNHHPLATEKGYKHYVVEMQRVLAAQGDKGEKELKSLQAQKRHAEVRAEDMKDLIRADKGDKVLVREYKQDLKDQLAKAKELDQKIQTLKAARVNAKDTIATYEDFHELFGNIANLIQKIDRMADLDYIMRKIFMNFTVTDKKVTKITQNSPFRELCEDGNSVLVVPRGFEPLFSP